VSDDQQHQDWLCELREMSLEEVFTLCASPLKLGSMPLPRQHLLLCRWDELVEQRVWEHLQDMRPWPTGRMLQDWSSLPLQAGAGRDASNLSKARYEAIRAVWGAGLIPEKAWAVEALRGAPEKSHLLSLPGAVWSYKKPGKIELHTVGPLQEDWDQFPLLDTLGICLSWHKDSYRRAHYCRIPSDRFPALAGLEVYLRTWNDNPPERGPLLRGVLHVRQADPSWDMRHSLGGQIFDLFCYRFDMVSHFPNPMFLPSITSPEDDLL
jgi:hypothetical protein